MLATSAPNVSAADITLALFPTVSLPIQGAPVRAYLRFP